MSTPGRSGERTRIQLCGRLSVELDGVELATSLRGRQVPLLLAYLVLNRERAVARDELIGMLWPADAPRSQDAAVRTLLSRLRSMLPHGVLAGRDELALVLPEPAWVDLEAATAQVASATEALGRGDARVAWGLAQVPLNIAGRGLLPGARAGWLQPRRRELADIRLQALEIIGRAGLILGATQLGSVQRAGRALIETEPYRESGYVLLMGALGAQGNAAEGLRVFERLRRLLRDELGTTPSPEALAAHKRLLHPLGVGAGGARGDTAAVEPAPPAIALPATLQAHDRAPLVGRQRELAELQRWWDAREQERAGALLLHGEPGIGKTRLLAQIADRVHARGGMVLAGHAPEEALAPYQPFLEALGHYAFHARLAELRSAARQAGPELARLIPEIRRRVPELPPPEPGDPETDRYRLFEAVAALLGHIAATGSLLIVLDDLHWADRPTLLLLRHLLRSPRSGHLRILGAYRAGEPYSDGLRGALTSLRREGTLRPLEVRGLPEGDAAALVRACAGATPSSALQRALYAETEGNPFFIEEIVRHLTESGVEPPEAGVRELERVGLPEDVRAVISRRLERLSPACVAFLRVAAIIGRDFDSALLERVLGFDEESFLAALEEALGAGLVVDSPGETGRYRFGHALVRETLYGGMSASRSARLHRRVGTALEERGEAGAVGALAHHFTRAAEPDEAERAIAYGLRAGARATAMLANEEAADHYARALEVLDRAAPAAPARRCELLLELGEAHVRSGERTLGWSVFREAAALAAELGDPASLARAAIGASRRYVQPPGVVDEELIALLQEALRQTTGEDTVTRVALLARLCGALYYSQQRGRMEGLSADATAIAARLGDPRATALAAGARRRANLGPPRTLLPADREQRLADSTLMLRAAREARDPELALEGHAWLVVDLLEAGDRPGVEAQVEAFGAGAEQLRQPLFIWHLTVWRAMLALLDGRLAEADRLAADALSSGMRPEGGTASPYHAGQLLSLRREQRRLDELEAAVRRLVADNPVRPGWRAALAMLLCETGRPDPARAELQRLVGAGAPPIPPDVEWMTAATLLADVTVELCDADRAEILYDRLSPHAGTHVVMGMGAVCLGAVARYLGRLAMTMGRRVDAREHLGHAIDENRALGALVELAHAQLDYASALGGGERARAQIDAAAGAAQERQWLLVARRAEVVRARLDR